MDTEQTTMKLGDEFDAALLGATIQGQFAYSLTRLAMIVMQDMKVHPEVAQQMVAQQVVTVMREHGDDAPVFIDDSLMFGADIAVEEEPIQELDSMETFPPGSVFKDGYVTDTTTGNPIFTGEPTPQSQPIFTGEKPDNVILIPGVTHGAIKGFLDPNGIKS